MKTLCNKILGKKLLSFHESLFLQDHSMWNKALCTMIEKNTLILKVVVLLDKILQEHEDLPQNVKELYAALGRSCRVFSDTSDHLAQLSKQFQAAATPAEGEKHLDDTQ